MTLGKTPDGSDIPPVTGGDSPVPSSVPLRNILDETDRDAHRTGANGHPMDNLNGDTHPFLDASRESEAIAPARIQEAKNEYFGDQVVIPYSDYVSRHASSYGGIRLTDYAEHHNYADAVILTDMFKRIEIHLRQRGVLSDDAPDEQKSLLVVGAGDGRLLQIYLELAKKLGIKNIYLNEMIPQHQEELRERAIGLFGSENYTCVDDVHMHYLNGDIKDVDIGTERMAIAVQFWFVANELLDPTSPVALREHRKRIYDKLYNGLIARGALVEDTIDIDHPGFYQAGWERTRAALKESGILRGVEDNLLLSYWGHEQEDTYFPYQLRFVNNAENDAIEKHASGFSKSPVYSAQRELPVHATVDLETAVTQLQRTNSLADACKAMTSTMSNVTLPESTDDLHPNNIGRRRITWWQKNGEPSN